MRHILLLAAGLCAACSSPEPENGANRAVAERADAADAQAEVTAEAAANRAAAARPSLSEAPFASDSAQGAASTVESLFSHVEAGRYDEAQPMVGKGGPDLRALYADFAEVHAEVLPPGPIEGAAGSRHVEIPVRVYGMLKNGKALSRPGKVVLKRVDAPGGTAGPRSWQVERID